MHSFTHVAVKKACIPRTFYDVVQGKNTFILTEGALSATVTMPVGVYNYRSFAINLATLMTAASPHGYSYTVSIPSGTQPLTGKYIITVTVGTFTITFPNTSYLYKKMGFESASVNTSTGAVLNSVNVCSFSDTVGLYICSDIVVSNKTVFNDTILESVFVGQTLSFGNIVFENRDTLTSIRELNPTKSDHFNFYLMDADQNTIDLNGNSWNIELIFYKIKYV